MFLVTTLSSSKSLIDGERDVEHSVNLFSWYMVEFPHNRNRQFSKGWHKTITSTHNLQY